MQYEYHLLLYRNIALIAGIFKSFGEPYYGDIRFLQWQIETFTALKIDDPEITIIHKFNDSPSMKNVKELYPEYFI